MFSESINTELYFIYGLIVVVILLIVVVLLIDRKDAKRNRRRVKLTDTLNMKPITDDMLRDKYQEDYEVVDLIDEEKEKALYNTKSLPEIKLDLERAGLIRESAKVEIEEAEEEIYHDTELDKTQAQIRVEEITKALEEAKVDEKIEEERDKYADYEEEQEKNAFISYEDLKKSYDQLYKENEERQYVEDNSIPINIKELYEASKQEGYVLEDEDVELLDTDKPNDNDIKKANDFLTTLKELRNNL